MQIPAQIFVWALSANEDELSNVPLMDININGQQVYGVRWTSLNKEILAYDAAGCISFYDPDNGSFLESLQVHKKQIKDVQFNRSKTLMISASVDMTAVVTDLTAKKAIKKFETDRPVNSAALSPIKEHVFMGGGQDAQSVTTTSGKSGKFEVRLFHLVYQEEFGRIKGHFGPINTLAICPDGRSFVSGGEDGYCRLHHLGKEYFEFYRDEDEADAMAEK
jgi:translation initiation factor 3 subunit I